MEAALKAYVHRPDYAALLALQVMDPIDPDYDPKGPYGLTPAALERRGWKTFEAARIAFEQQADKHIIKPVKKPLNPLNPLKAAPGKPSKKRVLTPA